MERASQLKTSRGNVVLDAIEAAHEAGTLRPSTGESTKTGLFHRAPDREPAAASVLVEVRLTAQACAVVDDLVAQTGHATRTDLLCTALSSYL